MVQLIQQNLGQSVTSTMLSVHNAFGLKDVWLKWIYQNILFHIQNEFLLFQNNNNNKIVPKQIEEWGYIKV